MVHFQAQAEQQVVHHHLHTVEQLQLLAVVAVLPTMEIREVQMVTAAQVVLEVVLLMAAETVVPAEQTQEILEDQAAVVPVVIQETVAQVLVNHPVQQ